MEGLKVYITNTGHGPRGPLYSARLGQDGEILVSGSTEPAFDAARVLVASKRDRFAVIEVWDNVMPFARMRGLLGEFARLTVSEPDNGDAPRFRTYRPYRASRGCPVSARTAISGPATTPATPEAVGPVRKEAA
jgi:hypothetical protein